MQSEDELSSTDVGEDPGYQSRSRSQSRRRRRQNQRQRQSKKGEEAGGAAAQSMAAVQEDEEGEEQAQAESSASNGGMFDRIGGPEQSMNGPVTHARAQRGEIPMRDGNPDRQMGSSEPQKGESSIMDQDGLKLRLELNLDIEIELKASIHGDLTLALL